MKTILEKLTTWYKMRMRILIHLGSMILLSSVILSSVSFAEITYNPTLNLVMMPPTPDYAVLLKLSTGNAIYRHGYEVKCKELKEEKALRERDRYIAGIVGVALGWLLAK